jgi:hypothetical protein
MLVGTKKDRKKACLGVFVLRGKRNACQLQTGALKGRKPADILASAQGRMRSSLPVLETRQADRAEQFKILRLLRMIGAACAARACAKKLGFLAGVFVKRLWDRLSCQARQKGALLPLRNSAFLKFSKKLFLS